MKRLVWSLSIIITALTFVACSKDKGGNANPAGPIGSYGSTPNDPACATGYAGYNYNMYQGGSYPGQLPSYPGNGYYPNRVNCIPPGSVYGGNPYYLQMNYQYYLGTCDFRFVGRGPLCPPGYTCQPAFGSMGVCMRGY